MPMLDFFTIATRSAKKDLIEIYPSFRIKKTQDLMIRGGDFYAVWVEDRGLWSTDEDDVLTMIDSELSKFAEEYKARYMGNIRVLYMRDAGSGMIDDWHRYCQKQMRDSYHMLDEKLIFANDPVKKSDYASKRLQYPLEECDISGYETLMSTLYSDEERRKIEWAIGSIISGDSKTIQKFLVLYGAAGTGKSTVLNIIQQLFDGYYSVFDAKALGSSSNAFALEAFRKNPLVAIQHDGDLSHIEDNTRLNSLVSHELMTVNEKFRSQYENRFKCFLFMGTNKPVKITDARSGLIRRLIDVSPSGNKLSLKDYKATYKRIPFELGGIAKHCLDVYMEDPEFYDDYIPTRMMGASNDFYNFIVDSYYIFKKENGTTAKAAWEMYKQYCEEAKVPYPLTLRLFKEELSNYFWEYKERYDLGEGGRVRSYFLGFRTDKFENNILKEEKEEKPTSWLRFDSTKSIFDEECKDCFAQYASSEETPIRAWDKVKTKLSQLDTSLLHYVRIPECHIVIDFDIPDENGMKSFEKNFEAASKWPATYAELSKSGKGIHLHYIYTGDPSKLSRIYDNNIEIKVFTGKSSLRRKLTKCNNEPIAKISSGLPLKGEKMVNFDRVKSENSLRVMIKRNLNKEIHPATKPSVDFIYKILEDAYASGMPYDVTNLRGAILTFAAQSTHQADYCIKLVDKMKFKSEEPGENTEDNDAPIVFYDVEVFPNLFLVNWKLAGKDKPVVRMINPKPSEIEQLLKFRLVGFNCRRYDNHMLYARLIGYGNEQLYNLSQKIIVQGTGFFGEAYNLSYTDVYDFCAKKQSLKKWEIELGIHHKELGLPWDQPVPEERWLEVAEYCDNDVIATEAVFDKRSADFIGRQILADLAGMTVNDTTNSLTTRIIFGKNKKPQDQFNYRDLSQPVPYTQYEEYRKKFGNDYNFRIFDDKGLPTFRSYNGTEKLPDGYSILPFFPGYKFQAGRSTFMGYEIGEGGRVFSRPGMYTWVWDGDIASQHPHSAIAEQIFGPYTKRFEDIVNARVLIKHESWDILKTLLEGKLAPYVEKVLAGEITAKDLAYALKIAINSVYGLTSANFDNPFRDIRNKDNIIAKRGALFMTVLMSEVEKLGAKVCHIKTDSIKIPNATEAIKNFVIRFGKEYGYDFETEAVFEKYCLVNDAVYVGKVEGETEHNGWTATGTQFQVPYVFKTLFSKEPIEFEDMCETKSVTSSLYLDMNEDLPDPAPYEKELSKIENKDGVKFGAEKKAEELHKLIDECHNYVFVGKVGLFCPVKPGSGGGLLMREKDGKYYSATGAKGYRWLESEMVKELGKESCIDRSYYDRMVDEAIASIAEYGDFEWFASDDVPPKESVSVPPWFNPSEPYGDEVTAFDVR